MMFPNLKDKKIELDINPSDYFEAPGFHGRDDKKKAWFKEKFGNKAYPFIEVYNFRPRLSWMCFDENGSGFSTERFTENDLTQMGVTEKMLLDAIEDQGGSTDISGYYAISDEIKQKIVQNL